jgi:enoyl-CoA hydratase/carnithine racemase
MVTSALDAVDSGFLDEVVAESDVLAVAIERAAELAALNGRAYAGTVLALRGPVLERMAAQITLDREAGTSPI